MKFYQAEMELLEFCKHPHTLKEWAEYGINQVNHNNKQYYDGGLNGEPHQFGDENPNTLLELDYLDKDEDGYTVAFLKDKDNHA